MILVQVVDIQEVQVVEVKVQIVIQEGQETLPQLAHHKANQVVMEVIMLLMVFILAVAVEVQLKQVKTQEPSQVLEQMMVVLEVMGRKHLSMLQQLIMQEEVLVAMFNQVLLLVVKVEVEQHHHKE